MTVITLTTDFGTADGFVGVMKGVILSIAPAAHLVDVSHEIAPQDIRQAAYVLGRAVSFFPDQTVHLAVVDPGVGSARRALVVVTPRARFVGPDNGLFTLPLAEPGARAFAMDRPEFWLPRVSRTFHGRDVFAPLAAHLALDVPPERMGRPVDDPVLLPLPRPTRLPGGGIRGEIVYVDHFGNLISNIPGEWTEGGDWLCQVAGRTLVGLAASYATAEQGAPLALVSSGETLEVAVRNGNAAAQLGAGPGTPVQLLPAAQARGAPRS